MACLHPVSPCIHMLLIVAGLCPAIALQGVEARVHFMLHLWIRARVSQPRDGSGGATLTIKGFAISESMESAEHKLAQLSNAGEW